MPETLHAWRHPRADGAAGRCIGRTDLAVDRRRAKRLARRIQAFARRQRLPQVVVSSPLRRCRDVGRWLARWGWRHRVDPALLELDFGRWDGAPWPQVPVAEIDAWCAAFAHFAPGGGEPLAALLARVRAFEPGDARIVVTHGGWLSAAAWLAAAAHGDAAPTSAAWPPAPAPGAHVELARAGSGMDGLAAGGRRAGPGRPQLAKGRPR